MKKLFIFLSIIFIFTLYLPYTVAHAEDNGVDDLRGRWDVAWSEDGFGSDASFMLYINDWRPSAQVANRYFAGGCMRTNETESILPLSMQADYVAEDHSYNIRIFSTAVLADQEPFVIRFDGNVPVFGSSVTDDAAAGAFRTEALEGDWSALHHDRRRTKCPTISGDFDSQAEVYAHKDLAYSPVRVDTILEAYTVIVSSGMQVQLPDGSTMLVQEYTDLFSPDVDFVGRFRYLTLFEGEPVQGVPYQFVLLDVFGDPIPGTESTDTYNRCNQIAPVNLAAAPNGDFINLSWDAVPIVLGEFDPGDYQITMWPMEGQAGEYGAGGIALDNHDIPLNPFVPPSQGTPDGDDFGQGLLEMNDGPYEVTVWAWNRADELNGGWGSDCAVRDSSQAMTMVKSGDQFTFQVNGSISGNVSDAQGPLAGVHVDACSWDGSLCHGAETNQWGNYRIFGLPEGDYRVFVWGGQGGWMDEFFEEKLLHYEATPVMVSPATETEGINFTMEQGGSISGTVRDAGGVDPIGFVQVNACSFDGTFCTGTQSGEDGTYVINGLPMGKDYQVFVWGQPGWAGEIYQETADWGLAAPVPVGATGIDFTLEPGGSISGYVYDMEGNPLGGIGVDVEQGGYGTCTDENGFYQLVGLPFGSHNIVAGHHYCGEHPFDMATAVNQAIDALAPDLGGVNFNLALRYNPSLHVVPAHPEIHGHGWNLDALVTIFVDLDDDLGNGFLYTATKPVTEDPWCGEPCFDVSGVAELPDGILPGYVVTMTDGEATRVVTVTDLVWTGTDINAELVFGTASPYSWVQVSSHGPAQAVRWVQADGAGYWEADFSVAGAGDDEQDILDLQPGFHGRAIQFDGVSGPDNGTLAYWQIVEP